MNDTSATSAPGSSLLPEGTAAITTAHLIIIAVLAILVIAGILWGMKLKRTRVQAHRDVLSNAEESGMPPAEASTPAEEVAPPVPAPAPTPVPVAPAPPPIGDAPVVGAPDALADEPIAAAAPFDANPAVEAAAPTPVPTASFADGPVTQLKGLGPKVAARLGEVGVTTVGQMAALSDAEAQALDAQLGSFTGRMARDRWIEQARLLANGDKAGFEAVFGKL